MTLCTFLHWCWVPLCSVFSVREVIFLRGSSQPSVSWSEMSVLLARNGQTTDSVSPTLHYKICSNSYCATSRLVVTGWCNKHHLGGGATMGHFTQMQQASRVKQWTHSRAITSMLLSKDLITFTLQMLVLQMEQSFDCIVDIGHELNIVVVFIS